MDRTMKRHVASVRVAELLNLVIPVGSPFMPTVSRSQDTLRLTVRRLHTAPSVSSADGIVPRQL
jgi:hypothetical protein